MKFKSSPYYSKEFLGKSLYENIYSGDKILTIQDFFNMNDKKKEYHIKDEKNDYKLKVFDNYYELDCKNYDIYLYLVFDKSVYITGEYCPRIIAPEIIIQSSNENSLLCCLANRVLINSNNKDYYEIYCSKVNSIYFHNEKINLNQSEIGNLFIFDKKLKFYNDSTLLSHHKIKCFGECEDLKNKILNYKDFKNEIIHIE